MNENMKLAALDYAQKLVNYYEMNALTKGSELHEDKMAARKAYDEMCDAQNNLAMMAETQASVWVD